MFHFLSKVLGYFTIPFVLITGILMISVIVKKKETKSFLFKLGLGLLLFFSNKFIANEVLRLWEIAPVSYSKLDEKYKVAIVLSGFTKLHDDYNDRVFLNLDRVTHSVQLYKKGIIEKFLISGGQGGIKGERLLEAEQIEQVLLIMGVSANDIMKELNSRNTHESSIEVAKILRGVDPKTCLLVTSASHMRRSTLCFKKAGFPAQPFSTDLISHTTDYSFESIVIPSTDALWYWQVISKEIVGCVAYKIMGYI
jgi:uncharacterized SAM-binding protein YcdF (DUF218 family)